MSTTIAATPQKAFASGVRLNIGLLSAEFDVVPARRPDPNKDTIHFICPDDHDAPARVNIEYVCPAGHRHKENELCRAYFGTEKDVEKIVPLETEDLTGFRCGDLADKNVDLHVHPVQDVETLTAPDESLYRVRPPKKAGTKQHEIYSLLLAMASDPKLALVGEFRFRDSRKLYRLRAFRGQLSMQSLIHPKDLAPVDDIVVPPVSKALQAQAKALLDSLAEPFTPEQYGVDAAAALAEIVAKRESAPAAPVIPIKAEDPSDLMAKLEASVREARKVATPSRSPRKSSARSKKAPAKRASAKRAG